MVLTPVADDGDDAGEPMGEDTIAGTYPDD
jgi:hypothetical protein